MVHLADAPNDLGDVLHALEDCLTQREAAVRARLAVVDLLGPSHDGEAEWLTAELADVEVERLQLAERRQQHRERELELRRVRGQLAEAQRQFVEARMRIVFSTRRRLDSAPTSHPRTRTFSRPRERRSSRRSCVRQGDSGDDGPLPPAPADPVDGYVWCDACGTLNLAHRAPCDDCGRWLR